jgi:hypothetical protein
MAEFPLLLFKVAAKATSSSLKTARAAAARKEMHVDRLLPRDGVDVVRFSPDDVPFFRAALIFFEDDDDEEEDESRDPGGTFWTRGTGGRKKARACMECIIALGM